MTCATLTLKAPYFAVNSDACRLENDSEKKKILSDVFHRFRLSTFKPTSFKENIILDIKCSLFVFQCVLLQRDFAVVNIERIEREISVGPGVQFQLFLSDFKQKWNRLTKV